MLVGSSMVRVVDSIVGLVLMVVGSSIVVVVLMVY